MLTINNVVKTFDGFTALKGVSLEAGPGTITGLIGPNGSGKSTLFNLITGVYSMDSGQVNLFGHPLDTIRPDFVARRGVMRTFQIPRLATRMTVLENLLAAPKNQAGERLRLLFSPRSPVKAEETQLKEAAWEMLNFLDLTHLANDWAGTLSGGQLKLLSIGMALMSDPEVLLLDEPIAGVNVALVARILNTLETVRAENKIILIIEHNIRVISDICEEIFVMDEGKIIAHGTPQEVREDENVRRAYLGVKAEA